MLAIYFFLFVCLGARKLPSCPSPKILAGAEGFEPPSSVLETDSLTVALTPLCSRSAGARARVPLFNLFMRRVLTATAAELLQLQPLRHRLAVFGLRIIPLFAITALHRNDLSGHKNSS